MWNSNIRKNTPKAKEIIELLIQNELGFADFYSKYAQVYDEADFWLKLAEEEKRHAQWLEALQKSPDIINVSKNFLSAMAIGMMIETIKKEISSGQKYSLEEALKLSLKFEKSFAENHFFEVFEPDSLVAKEVMEKLARETAGHIRRIKNKIENL